MKELDLLLEHFVSTNHAALAAGDWPEFESLLGLEDDVLWDSLQDPRRDETSPYRKLIADIRDGRN